MKLALAVILSLAFTPLAAQDFDKGKAAANLAAANLIDAYMPGATLCNTTMPDGSVIYSGC